MKSGSNNKKEKKLYPVILIDCIFSEKTLYGVYSSRKKASSIAEKIIKDKKFDCYEVEVVSLLLNNEDYTVTTEGFIQDELER